MTTATTTIDDQAARPPATLADQLAASRAAEQPLRLRVNALEQAMREAAERSDYTEAEEHRQQLDQARHALGIASATTTALQGAADEVERQRQEDVRVIERQRARDQAQQRLNAASEQEQALMDELQRTVAEYHAGLAAVQQTYRYGLQLEQEVTRHRGEVLAAQAVLAAAPGETPQVRRATPPNNMSVLAEYHEHVRVLARAQL